MGLYISSVQDGKREEKKMDDLINRQDAINAIELIEWYHQNKNKDMVSGANSDEHQAWYKAEDIYQALEQVPSAEPKKGEWIATHETNLLSHPDSITYVCSECGYKIYTLFGMPSVTNFCSKCGADMQKKRGEIVSDLVKEKNCEECMWITTCANARPSCYEPMKECWTPSWGLTLPRIQPTKVTTGTGIEIE